MEKYYKVNIRVESFNLNFSTIVCANNETQASILGLQFLDEQAKVVSVELQGKPEKEKIDKLYLMAS